MVQNSKFALRVLEKIGAPLAAALEAHVPDGDDQEVESAKLMAQMMGQAVQVSIALNSSLNIVESEEQADSTRLALAALAAPIIAEFYRQNGRVPEEQDIKRIIKSQEAVMAFAENFTAADEGKSRLTTIEHDSPLFDQTQMSLVVLQTMTPVISAIFEFPFGQSETKLLQEVGDRLQKDAGTIVSKESGDDLGKVMVIKALAEIYTECHRAETARLATASDENRGELSLDPVWKSYQTKLAMVEVITGGQTGAPSTVNNSGDVAPSNTPIVEQQSPVASAPPADATPPTTAPPSGGPMGFFKAPGASAPPAEAAAPVTPTPAAPVTPSTETPPPPEVPPTAPAGDADTAPPSGPMGFFKPGVKKPDDDAESGQS